MSELKQDKELEAMKIIIEVLSPLDAKERERVIEYVFNRLGINLTQKNSINQPITAPVLVQPQLCSSPDKDIIDIKSLKEQKQPSNDAEMAAIVGYYLSELAPIDERKKEIGQKELEKYFKQARFELPKHIRMTLPVAKDSGYFDSVKRGKYKLNPVGYNLVAHKLPYKQAITK